ncbi:short transient receptor potential channel 2-like [Xyrauchen texanus]|uniref:short transient receptor potential channel 2-like n=1 Tax=Xyrauchen texanus TaxID=154827 RepID=UPI002242A2A5|nr:short transient receptor potential channel 2-like [Xyrauchen texanus]
MAPIRIKHIVSFTSQDSKNGVDNLCGDGGGNSRPWLCNAQDRSGVLRVELQMERAFVIGFIDVGNCGSAFIQVDVGRSSWPLHHPYVTLLPTATLMSPADSKEGTGRQTVRMFKKADFLPQVAEESWDRLRVTCTQPFNKRLQFGLSFLRIRTTEDQVEEAADKQEGVVPQNLCTPDKMISVRGWLSSPAIQNTFFGRITGDGSPNDAQTKPESFSWAERMVKAAQTNSRSISSSPCSTASSTTAHRDNDMKTPPDSGGLRTSSDIIRTAQEQRRKSKARQSLINHGTTLKRSRAAAFTDEPITTSKGVRTKKQASNSPVDIKESTCHAPQSSTEPLSPETLCPLCGVSFSPDFLPLHAATCLDSDPVELSGVMSSRHSFPVFHSGADELLVSCPLCSIRFPPDRIQQHASTCGDTVEPSIIWMNMENLTPDQWREIVNKKLCFPAELLGAIREGNIHMITALLKTGDGIIRQLDDSEDRQWREALNLSIRLGNEDTMDTLLQSIKFDFRQIHEALLVAVDTNQPRVVKRLLDRLDQEKGNKMDVRSFSQAIFDHSIDDSQFAPGVTPLTLACQKDLYDIVTMLSQKGHVIPWPHKMSCACLECRNGRQYDLLKFSLSRINTYRGIASRAYLSITAEDAMLSTFRLSRDLRKLSKKEPEFKPQYIGLEELCQEFAVELLGMCRNQSEVTTILNSCVRDEEDSDDELDQQAFEEGIPNLARLRLAVNLNQKQFVAHPICQQVLSSIWCGNLSGWRGSRTAWKLLVSLGIFLSMPLLCFIYWIAPKSKLGKTLKIPVIKFLLHSASYMWFLITLLGESIAMEMHREEFASREQNILHNSFHMIWVIGFFWFECKEVWIEGLRTYFLDWWNCLDVMVLSMYLASFAMRVVIMLKSYFVCQEPGCQDECVYFTETSREDWHQEDPQFIAEVLFAVTSMLSFTRLAYILPAHESLGTLQISIGKMIDDMMRFMFILVIIGTAFLCGINNTYVPYVISPRLGRLNETFRFLFWTMFGVADQTNVDMDEFALAELVGRILYGIYTLLIVIVLLNMLIAMITNSFQKIEDDADVEWKFARSKLYLSYFREGLTMPVPFNIIPSPKALFYLLRGIFRRICCCCLNCNSAPDYPPIASLDDGAFGESRISYKQQVIRALVQRYIESARREFEETKRKDVGNRITELSKVVARLHAEMKQLHNAMQDSSDDPKADPSEGSSFLGKYIHGAKNNFRGFNSNERKTPPSLVHHEEPKADTEDIGDGRDTVEERDGEDVDMQDSPGSDIEANRKSNEEPISVKEKDDGVEGDRVDTDVTNGREEEGNGGDLELSNDGVIEISVEEEAETNIDSDSQTVIEIESNIDTELSGKSEEQTMMKREIKEEFRTDEGDTWENVQDEIKENAEGCENNVSTEYLEDRSDEDVIKIVNEGNASEDNKTELNKRSLVSFMAKRIEESIERTGLKEINFSFSGKQVSSPTGSDDSQDTGFGSQEFDLGANSSLKTGIIFPRQDSL